MAPQHYHNNYLSATARYHQQGTCHQVHAAMQSHGGESALSVETTALVCAFIYEWVFEQ